MSFGHIKLNDGSQIPGIAYGSAGISHDDTPFQIEQAIGVGFEHIDTAQMYGNEQETGDGVRLSGLARRDIWVTTKWSGSDGKGVVQSARESLDKLQLEYVDLYLIHNTRICNGDVVAAWRGMEEVYRKGWARCIGVSNFGIEDLRKILDQCSIKPAVNQIILHPGIYADTKPLLDYMAQHHIVAEGYSPLQPLRSDPTGRVSRAAERIAHESKVTPEAVLLAWMHSKGVVAVTKSSRKDRLEGMLHAGKLKLTEHDIRELEGGDSALHVTRYNRFSIEYPAGTMSRIFGYLAVLCFFVVLWRGLP